MPHIPLPTFAEEQLLWNGGLNYIAGVDEVGRGAFAGPVVAAAVILPKSFPTDTEITDSKLLSPQKREEFSEFIQERAVSFAIASVSVPHINKYGIGKATQNAFRKAVKMLSIPPDFILIDAFYIKKLAKKRQKPIIKGDRLSISIAAASIIAKVYRDNLMSSLPKQYHQYDFAIHKGYGTKQHRRCIQEFGLCDIHRTSFDLLKYL